LGVKEKAIGRKDEGSVNKAVLSMLEGVKETLMREKRETQANREEREKGYLGV